MAVHHTDEIPSVFKHVLILKRGEIAGAGDMTETMTSDIISRAFSSPLRIERRDGRFHMSRA